jgi:DNA polymerase epsilon subunit 1
MTQAKKAFEYLRKMIRGWIDDLNINLEKSNDLLRNFHKWITTHSNALYDPLLYRIVNELMKKMFNILIKKLNNLGVFIIYASFSKIIVATDKHTYKEA